jgi:uncharacterized membrane protein YdjX (TVP38/TMEM64 family)
MGRATRRQALGVAGLAAVALAAALTLSPGVLVDRLTGLTADPVAFVAVLGAVYLARPFLLWPVTALAVLVGYLYGPVVGVPVALAGTGLSNLPPFLIARRADTDAGLLAPFGTAGDRLVGTVGEVRGVLAARLLPLPGDAVSYGAGLSGLSTGPFLVGTVVGEVPWATVAVLTGDSMRRLSLSAVRPSLELVAAGAGLALLVLAGPVYGHFVGPNGRSSGGQ